MKLSIITINWNNRDGLKMTIDNVLGQTARNDFEYIVVDGGADDGSQEMLEKEYDGRIDKWVSQPIKPIYQKMNMGVQLASGDYCLFLNSGDRFHGNDAIEVALTQLHSEDLIIGKMIFEATGLLMQATNPISLLFLFENSIPHNAAFIKRELLIQFPYDERLRIVSDWKFFVQALILNNASYRLIDNIISEFDCGGISSKNRDLCEKERRLVLKELFPDRVLLDYYKFLNGSSYQDTTYDRFYTKLRNYRAGKALFSINVLIMRIFGFFKKSAEWAKDYPIILDR
ncbi:MAG: glycosyltransferase [Bacteroidales bacterium]|nr:glycosyltransferase [Bacteroidales bacterium]